MRDYLVTHKDFVIEYSKMISDYVSNNKVEVNLVDENIINDLMKQEDEICGGVDMTTSEALAADGVDYE